MRNVPCLKTDDRRELERLIKGKQEPRRTLLRALRFRIANSYKRYLLVAPNVERLKAPKLTTDERDALLHTYSDETVALLELRGKLLRRVLVVRCPMCGIGESTELDHYLPKELNPLLSVFPKNLVPCCGKCNRNKSDLLIDPLTNNRYFLHPYFDKLPTQRFIKVDITVRIDSLKLDFQVERPKGMRNNQFQQLQSHFQRLELSERYSINSLEHLRSRRKDFENIYGAKAQTQKVSRELLRQAIDFEEDNGPNDWRAVLYRGLAESAAFCGGGFRVLDKIQ